MLSLRTFVPWLAAFGILASTTMPAGAARLAPPAGDSGRIAVADAPHFALDVRDLGRRAPSALVRATVTLRYNHQAELDALVAAQSNSRSPLFRHFLTSEQFNEYFAPTPRQEAAVVAALRAGGLTVTRTYPNRTLLDVAGTSAAAERFFGTEIHTVVQGSYGLRFANVRPVTVPADLAASIRTVSLSNVIVAHVTRHAATHASHLPALAAAGVPAVTRRANATPYNFIADPGFESGGLKNGWIACGTGTPAATISTAVVHSGKYAGRAGSTSTTSGEPNGYTGLCQLVKIPRSGILSAFLYQLTNQTNTASAAQEVLLLDTSFHTVATLRTSAVNQAGWGFYRWNLAAYGGRQLYVSFGVQSNGDKSHYTIQYVDDVSLNEYAASSCQGVPENGAFLNSNGDKLATSVADAFDMPVQYGCDGSGATVAVEIDSPVKQTDINAYLAASGVKQTGKITQVAIDGGGTYNPSQNSDTGEATLDVETVSGLAPGADIIVYNFPDLSDQSIEDGYNQTVSDNKAAAVNSSFGGCESADPSGSEAENTIAEQGASKGITFAASSGDSGSDECSTGNKPPGPSGPASDPYFVAVGAVDFTQNAAGTLTSITSAMDGMFLSGGGVSTVFKLPSYQQGVTNVITSGRNTPDVSLAGVDTAVYQGGTEAGTDGTSWSCPQFTALLASAIQLHGNAGRFGWLNPKIYEIFQSTAYTDFTDVTTGNNGYYSAKKGYDQVTGIGAPVGYAFARAI
jgi:hypothetical protein